MEFLFLILALFAAIVAGKLAQKGGLPAVLGWLLAGIMVGPYAIGIISFDLMDKEFYHFFKLCGEIFVGLMIGLEILFFELKESGKKLSIIAVFEALGTYLIVAAGFILFLLFIDLGPLNDIVVIAFLFGTIALATAPGPSLAMVKEYNASGPVSKSLVVIAALDDILALLMFGLTASIAGAYFSGAAINISVVISTLSLILVMLLLGLVIGLLVYVFYLLVPKMNNNLLKNIYIVLITSVIVIVGAIAIEEVAHVLDKKVNILMYALGAGVTFGNLVVSYEDVVSFNHDELKKIISPLIVVFLLFFIVDTGATLDWRTIGNAGFSVVIYVVFRTLGKLIFTNLGAVVSKSDENVRKYLGYTLLPHAGVSLVFTGMITTSLSKMGVEADYISIIAGTIAAAAVINEILAVILAKRAFKNAGEI